MAILITPLLTQITPCDADDWVGGTGTLDTDNKREGSGCLALKVSASLSVVAKYDQGGAGGVDMRGQHFFAWFRSDSILVSRALGGLRIYAEDTSGNWTEWYVGGSDNYAGGWQRYAAYSEDATGENQSGTYNPQFHRYIGVRFYTSGKSTVNNVFWDDVRYGSGLKITSGATDQITWDDIYNTDTAAAHGIVNRSGGTYYVQGALQFGDNSSGDIDFKDVSKIIIFPTNPHISSSLYTITVVGNAGGTTNFQLGEKVGSSGVQGCILYSVNTSNRFYLTAVDTDIDVLRLCGCTFLRGSTISLPPNASNREVLGCTFDTCDEILPDTCVVAGCTIASAVDRGLRIAGTGFNVTDSQFINCLKATNIITASDAYIFDNLKFYGNTYDIENSSTGYVEVNNINGSNASTYTNTNGGTTYIPPLQIQFTLTGLQSGTEVRIYKDSDNSLLGGVESSGTSYTYFYDYTVDVPVYVRIHHLNYEWMTLDDIVLSNANQSIPIQQRYDRNYNNPS